MQSPRWYQRPFIKIARTRPGARFYSTVAPTLDRWILSWSGGKHTATSIFTGYQPITLTTTGAKSGQPRQVTLLAIPDGERLVLVASNFGNASHPAWYHNLVAHPQVQVTLGSRSRAYLAQPAEGDERQRLWELAAAYYPGYDNYQANVSSRSIPVVVLTLIQP